MDNKNKEGDDHNTQNSNDTKKKKKKTQINKEMEHSKITILMINLSSTSLLGQ